MCTHKIQIVNKRTGRLQYVNCGHCKSCLQAKANKRTARIRNHEQSTGRIALFITLTYDNRFIPYIKPSELHYGARYNIYRDYDVRYVRPSDNKNGSYKSVPKAFHAGIVETRRLLPVTNEQRYYMNDFDYNTLPLLRKKNYATGEFENVFDRTSVAYYKDFQDFYKRFEINFQREYGYRPARSYYVCTEYGETYRRCHFHMLLFCYDQEKEKIERHVRKAWPYTGNRRKLVDIQVARSAASYVSQYVNCGSDFPVFLRLFHRPKAVMSRNFGRDNYYFRLDSLIRMFEKNDWSFPCQRMLDGRSFVQYTPVPRYVLSSWFPQFVGFSRLPSSALYDCALRPHALQALRTYACQRDDVQGSATIRLLNAGIRFRKYLGQRPDLGYAEKYGREWYAYFYSRVWQSYISYLQRWSYENYDINDSWFNYYENIGDVIDYHTVRSDLSDVPIPDGIKVFRHPDEQPWNVRISHQLADLYDKKKKQSKVSNLAMTDGLGLDV